MEEATWINVQNNRNRPGSGLCDDGRVDGACDVVRHSSDARGRFFGLYNFLNIFSKVGTTTFIFLSSFVLFYNYYHRPFKGRDLARFFKNRLMYILVPYLLFSVLFFTVAWYHRGGEPNLAAMLQSFWPKLATGNLTRTYILSSLTSSSICCSHSC